MTQPPFSVGVSYWPRQRAGAAGVLPGWAEADFGAVRDQLGHIAAIGFDTLRLDLRWAEAQPGPARIAPPALRALERALDLAHDHGLRAVVSLMGGAIGGVLHLPEWAVGFRLPSDSSRARRLGPPLVVVPDDQPAILAGDRYRREPTRDLYDEPELREAEVYLLREVVGYFAAHPALAGWLLAPDLERVRRASSARAVAAWWSDLAERARTLGARQLFGAVDAYGLGRADTLRPEQIHAAGAQLLVGAAPLPPLAPPRPWEVTKITFLQALVVGLLAAETRAAVPVVVADIGVATSTAGAAGQLPSEAFGRSAPALLVTEERQAELVEAALPALYAAGAAGAWLAGYADPAPSLWGMPPLDRSWPPRSWGIVAADDREKPAAAAVRAFVARLRAESLPAPASPPALPIDPERYWRDPGAQLRALWADWVRD